MLRTQQGGACHRTRPLQPHEQDFLQTGVRCCLLQLFYQCADRQHVRDIVRLTGMDSWPGKHRRIAIHHARQTAVKQIMKSKDHDRNADQHMKRQAEYAYDVVGIQPEALAVFAGSQRKKILDQGRQ